MFRIMSRPKNGKKQGKNNGLQITVQDRDRWKDIDVPGRKLGWEWREQGQQVLVLPSTKARWSETSPYWRSVLLRSQEVTSVGLPKFWDPEKSPQGVQA